MNDKEIYMYTFKKNIAKISLFILYTDKNEGDISRKFLRKCLSTQGISSAFDVTFIRGKFGKPYLVGECGIEFSLTHTKGLIACAISRTPVGCDAEIFTPLISSDVFIFLSEFERAYLTNIPESPARDKAFLKIWVAKEAFAKALGKGLALDFTSFDVDITGTRPRISRRPLFIPYDSRWRFEVLALGEQHVLAIAAEGEWYLSVHMLSKEEVEDFL